MQFNQIQNPDLYLITDYSATRVTINGIPHHTGLILRPAALYSDWPLTSLDALIPQDHLQRLLAAPPEILILGTGPRQAFPRREIWRELRQMQPWGVEIMDTPAACRTYNLIASEGRDVAAALLISHGEHG